MSSLIVLVICALVVIGSAAILERRMLEQLSDIRTIESEALRNYIKHSVRESFEPPWFKKGLISIFPVALLVVLDEWLMHMRAPYAVEMMALASVMPIIIVVQARLIRTEVKHFIWRRLAGRGVLICLHCGYDLQGQTMYRCPECGTAFDPKRLTYKVGGLYAIDAWRSDKPVEHSEPEK